jgi:membrane protease YdiL (CAAX protease family)
VDDPIGPPHLSPEVEPAREEPIEGDRTRSPDTPWRPWMAPVALFAGLGLAVVGGLVVEIPLVVFGVKITSSHTPPGVSLLDTVVQDVGFVAVAMYFARLGGRAVRSWQFGLRSPGIGWGWASLLIVALLGVFLVLTALWAGAVHPKEDTKLLETFGSNEGTALLLLSAGLTCVVAPICEELLFRGFIFTALRNWRGTLPAALLTGLIFGGVHYGSAPALDLVPLAALGFGLCLLYRYSGSLYTSIAAHSLNNSLAFSGLEDWGWQVPVLIVGSLLAIAALAWAFKRMGLIESTAALPRSGT